MVTISSNCGKAIPVGSRPQLYHLVQLNPGGYRINCVTVFSCCASVFLLNSGYGKPKWKFLRDVKIAQYFTSLSFADNWCYH
jgi:hypothetical protein